MKKSSFAVASVLALLVSMPALADDNNNTSNIDQIGVNMSASVTQTGEGNTSNVDIDQGLGVVGNNLSATVFQGGLTGDNEALITQNDTNQSLDLDQHGDTTTNFASVTQNGIDNDAIILQNGTMNTNTATINQTGTGPLNTVDVMQGGMNNALNSTTVTQTGGGLSATVVQN